jgi:DNA modification methylase
MMGSGTVAKMCVVEDRNYIGSEIVKDYCKIADKRLTQIINSIEEYEYV